MLRFFDYDAFPKNTLQGIYFHSLADEFMGHDIPTMEKMEEIPLGETDVEVVNQNNEVSEAICITWNTEYNQQKGLIVLKRDSPATQYARKLAARNQDTF